MKEKRVIRLEAYLILIFAFLLALITMTLSEIIWPEESNIVFTVITASVMIGSFIASVLLRLFYQIEIKEIDYKSFFCQIFAFSFLNVIALLLVAIYSDDNSALVLFSIHFQFLLFTFLFASFWHAFWLYRRLAYKQDNINNSVFRILMITSYMIIDFGILFILITYSLRP